MGIHGVDDRGMIEQHGEIHDGSRRENLETLPGVPRASPGTAVLASPYTRTEPA